MRIEKIAYEQLYPTGVYANQRYRVEISLDENDYGTMPDAYITMQEATHRAFQKAKEIIEETFIKLNPQINWNDRLSDTAGLPNPYGSINVYAPIPAIDPKKQDLVDKINDCTSPEELNLLMNDSMRYGLVEQFINKKKSLQ